MVNKRIAAKQSHLMYNRGGTSLEQFWIHLRFPKLTESSSSKFFVSIVNFWKRIRFPKLKDSSNNKFFVPILYRIKEDGIIYDIAVEENYQGNIFKSYQLATSHEFELEAIRLMNQSGIWTPFSYNSNYVNREGRYFITFEYHPEYFKNKKDMLILNPDNKPSFIGDQELYNRLIYPKYGSDGQATFLVIIEKDGTMSNEYCLGVNGKTNSEICLHELKKLSSWKPASQDGRAVRTQLKITIKPY